MPNNSQARLRNPQILSTDNDLSAIEQPPLRQRRGVYNLPDTRNVERKTSIKRSITMTFNDMRQRFISRSIPAGSSSRFEPIVRNEPLPPTN